MAASQNMKHSISYGAGIPLLGVQSMVHFYGFHMHGFNQGWIKNIQKGLMGHD
jgi:hypothetical protein